MSLSVANYQEINDAFEKVDFKEPSAKVGVFYSPYSSYLINENQTIAASIIIDHHMLKAIADKNETCAITFKFKKYGDLAGTLAQFIKGREAQKMIDSDLQFETVKRNGYSELSFTFSKDKWKIMSEILSYAPLVGGKCNTQLHKALQEQVKAASTVGARPRIF